MRTTTALTFMSVGAIMAFAVHGTLPFFDPNVAGWVVMLAGTVGLFLPSGTQRWLRQRLVLRGGRYGPAMELSNRRYSRRLMPAGLLQPGTDHATIEGAAIEEHVVE
jgi:hypothetical protein